ncbi:MAG TPA: hypothetical protein VES67_23200 [Vicinamibacterales bacterium]|nr:hypothetical protein [Vicinamibacterales bacterium]
MSETLRSFRRNAVHIRQALDVLAKPEHQLQVDGGYLQEEGLIERYKRLSIPVRRALNTNDRASFAQALSALDTPDGSAHTEVATARSAWQKLQQELDSTVGLGGSKVPRRQILGGWLDAAAFYDKLDRVRAYDQLIDQWGHAAEGIGSQLMEEAARAVLLLDGAAAHVLGEPVILPPPVKTPPPPPDPKESWWKRLFDWGGRP